MLKCLELVGFKSFADKTRFEFDAGVTAIVGPNGSGKSNVVDSIRWILGEQSAKSLRGKEMADVIFNGSGTRRSLGLAEVSLTLYNRGGYLPIESDEVVITRRVYRSGEGEYLINGQIARLRDIRDLFLGTGAGAGAYSIIEQGKVELMLQASTKDRRHIFEEAAGTSKFKAKKIEALRRLDRIDQNLLRVQDIHEEVEKQLRGLRTQAGKARKYKEYADRLEELRLLLGKNDYRSLSRQLTELAALIEPARVTIPQLEGSLKEGDERLAILEEAITRQEEAAQRIARVVSEVREKISALESEIAADQKRDDDFSDEMLASYHRLRETVARRRTLSGELSEVATRKEQITSEDRASHAAEVHCRTEVEGILTRLDANRKGLAECRQQASNFLASLSRLENEQAGLDSQLSILWEQHARLISSKRSLARSIRDQIRSAAILRQQEIAVRLQLGRCQASGSDLQSSHRMLLERRSELLRQLAALRDRQTAVRSRLEVLENLRHRHEGLQGGVRQALARQTKGDLPWQCVLGVLAECLVASGADADFVELGLGSRAQALLVPSRLDLSEELLREARALPGRVLFLPIDELVTDELVVFSEDISGPSLASLVQCDERFRPLVDQLLGTTFLVEDYPTARRIADTGIDVRLVTRQGDVIEADGTVSAGPHRVTAGILSRTAEIHELQKEDIDLSEEVAAHDRQVDEIDQSIAEIESRLGRHELLQSTLSEQSRHFDFILKQGRQRLLDLENQLQKAEAETVRVDEEIAQVDQKGVMVAAELSRIHEELQLVNRRSASLESLVGDDELQKQRLEEQLTVAKIERAKVEERLRSCQLQEEKLRSDLTEIARSADALSTRLAYDKSRALELGRRLLANRANLAELYHRKDQISQGSDFDPGHLQALRDERRVIREQVTKHRQEIDNLRTRLHSSEIQSTELRLQRETLLARIREDYGVDLSEEDGAEVAVHTPEELEAARLEAEQLRDKISRLGSVNMTAIAELEDLELRAGTLAYQLSDLTTAKRHLEEVISKINEESRRLFLDTFETVREHFQELFRKLFGGGKADILLEDETDVLESGIEIIARPPGKEPRSISLLSGGEKTMTAVALLMALFRSKPTPFCILDEVDAALDEANISRFVASLREFLDRSQFILITHSKTTMAAADVLHGVTQRESGVSIRVSVRLDDVTEDGHIIERSESAQAG